MGNDKFDYTNVGNPSPSGPPFSQGAPPPGVRSPQGDWWAQNRRWVIPMGCVGGLAAFLLAIGFAGAIVYGVFSLMRSSEAYQQGLARAKAHPTVQALLGEPIEEGWYLLGNHQESGPTGNANLQVPLEGPNGKGTLYLSARKSAGQWQLLDLQFEDSETGRRFNLLSESTPAP